MPNLEAHGIGNGTVKGLKTIEVPTMDDSLKPGDIAYAVEQVTNMQVVKAKNIPNTPGGTMTEVNSNQIRMGKYLLSSYWDNISSGNQAIRFMLYDTETDTMLGLFPTLKLMGNTTAYVRKLMKIDATNFYVAFVYNDTTVSKLRFVLQHWTINTTNGALVMNSEYTELGAFGAQNAINNVYNKGTKVYTALQDGAILKAKIYDSSNGIISKVTDFTCPTAYPSYGYFVSQMISNGHFVIAGKLNGAVETISIIILKLSDDGLSYILKKDMTNAFYSNGTNTALQIPMMLMETESGLGAVASYYNQTTMVYTSCVIDWDTYTITPFKQYTSIQYSVSSVWSRQQYIVKSIGNTHWVHYYSKLVKLVATSRGLYVSNEYVIPIGTFGDKTAIPSIEGNIVSMIDSDNSGKMRYVAREVDLHTHFVNSKSFINMNIFKVIKMSSNVFMFAYYDGAGNNTLRIGAFRVENDGSITFGTTVSTIGTNYSTSEMTNIKLNNINITRGTETFATLSNYAPATTSVIEHRLLRVDLNTLAVTSGVPYSYSQPMGNFIANKITESSVAIMMLYTGSASLAVQTFDINFTTLELIYRNISNWQSPTGQSSTGQSNDLIWITPEGGLTQYVIFHSNAYGMSTVMVRMTFTSGTLACTLVHSSYSTNGVGYRGLAYDKTSQIIRYFTIVNNSSIYELYDNASAVDFGTYVANGQYVAGRTVDNWVDSFTMSPIKGTDYSIAYGTYLVSSTYSMYERRMALIKNLDSYDSIPYIPSLDIGYSGDNTFLLDDGRLLFIPVVLSSNYNISFIGFINLLSAKKGKNGKPIGTVSSISGNKTKIKAFA